MTDNLEQTIQQLYREIQQADAVVVGGGSGLSSAAGYNHYHWDTYFKEKLKPFIDYYGFKSPFDGFYHVFSDYESQWGYYAGYIQAMYEAPTGTVYHNLAKLLKNKDVFVLTTNIDMQFQRVFPSEILCHFQGDFGYLQCSQPCHDRLYPNRSLVQKMISHLDRNLCIPQDLIPRCEECGRVMVPWARDDTFLQGESWKEGFARYNQFIHQHLAKDQQILLLELGVGDMTPSIIKLPFWEMTHKYNNIYYARVNNQTESAPEHIKEKSLNVKGDIHFVIAELVKHMEADHSTITERE